MSNAVPYGVLLPFENRYSNCDRSDRILCNIFLNPQTGKIAEASVYTRSQ